MPGIICLSYGSCLAQLVWTLAQWAQIGPCQAWPNAYVQWLIALNTLDLETHGILSFVNQLTLISLMIWVRTLVNIKINISIDYHGWRLMAQSATNIVSSVYAKINISTKYRGQVDEYPPHYQLNMKLGLNLILKQFLDLELYFIKFKPSFVKS